MFGPLRFDLLARIEAEKARGMEPGCATCKWWWHCDGPAGDDYEECWEPYPIAYIIDGGCITLIDNIRDIL